MPERRKDSKGRVLRTGESQRKVDSLYQYRYMDARGKRQTLYARDLQELRRKEDEVRKQREAGLLYLQGKFTVIQLLERYLSLKANMRQSTSNLYQYILNLVKEHGFGYKDIKEVRVSDVQQLAIDLHKSGKAYNTILSVKSLCKVAFQMACDDDLIPKNPFSFSLSGIVQNDAKKREALTREQQEAFLGFLREDAAFGKYYDHFVVLLGTGMRVSEFCGLTKGDLDFSNRRIRVDHQLLIGKGGKFRVEKPKSKCGIRYLPMTEPVFCSLQRMLEERPDVKEEAVVDGYSGFLLLNSRGHLVKAKDMQRRLKLIVEKYNSSHPDSILPPISPHVLRHTFCTNMADAGMSVNALQYLMGHANPTVTLHVYTHNSYEQAAMQMAQLASASRTEETTSD